MSHVAYNSPLPSPELTPAASPEASVCLFGLSDLKRRHIIVTGAAGYIGSHCMLGLIQDGFQVVGIDDLSNSSIESLERVALLTKTPFIPFYKASILNTAALRKIFSIYNVAAVIHFAGLKAVGESIKNPEAYYQTNVIGTMRLLDVMKEFNVQNIVFSSSATVYGGNADKLKIGEQVREDFPLKATNPYGRSKLFVEEILRDYAAASDPNWKLNVAILRYFNPVGAHPSGLIGEHPQGTPSNLLPYITQVCVGQRPYLGVNGANYPTPDGTAMRDFIHVMDLVDGHILALERLVNDEPGVVTYNLGTGKGYSVMDMLKGMEKASGKRIPFKFCPERPGDVSCLVADPSKAYAELGWKAKRDITHMCHDAWNWQRNNPHGYCKAENNNSGKSSRRDTRRSLHSGKLLPWSSSSSA